MIDRRLGFVSADTWGREGKRLRLVHQAGKKKLFLKVSFFVSRSAARALTSRVVRPLRKALERPSIFHAASKYPWSFFGLL